MLRHLIPRRTLSLSTSPRISQSRTLATTSTPSPSNYPELKVTTLPNGVRVASDPTPGHFVAAGVYVDAGSRYESLKTRGAGHMVDRLGFKVRMLFHSQPETKEQRTSCLFVSFSISLSFCNNKELTPPLHTIHRVHGTEVPTK